MNGLLALLLLLFWVGGSSAVPEPFQTSGATTTVSSFKLTDAQVRKGPRPLRAAVPVDHRHGSSLYQQPDDAKPRLHPAGGDFYAAPAHVFRILYGRLYASSAREQAIPRSSRPRTADARAPPSYS
jgi:hypothetical protein